MADNVNDTKPDQSKPAAEVAGNSPENQTPTFDTIALMKSQTPGVAQSGKPQAAEAPKPAAPADATKAGASCPANPDYEKYIDVASHYIYDPKDLGDISGLEHKFDCDIKSTLDIFTYANQALAVSGDRFNHAMDKGEAKDFERQQRGGYSGIGLEIVPAILQGKPNPAAAAGGDHPAGATVIKTVVPGKAAEAAGLKAGDSFVKIDGKDVHTMSPGDISDLITSGQPNTNLDIVVDRQGQEVEKVATRQAIVSPPVVHDKDLINGIAYIKIDNFASGSEADQLAAAMDKHKDAKAYIIDVRNNPGGLVEEALQSAALFIKDGTIMTARQRHYSSPDKPVYDENKITLGPNGITTTSTRSDNGVQSSAVEPRLPYKADGRPVVILTDENSASAAEIFTGAVHDTAHDTTVGAKTYGKGIGQTVVKNMPDGGYLKVTSLHYLTPAGNWPGDADKHKNGLEPDFPATNLPNVEPQAPVLDTNAFNGNSEDQRLKNCKANRAPGGIGCIPFAGQISLIIRLTDPLVLWPPVINARPWE